MVNQLHERINATADSIIDSVIEEGKADFVTDLAAELPLVVIAELLGVPNEDRHRMFDWSNRMIGSRIPNTSRARRKRHKRPWSCTPTPQSCSPPSGQIRTMI